MRLNFIFFILLLFGFTANAQKLTGIWRGHFSSSGGIYREGVREEMYKYEIQIEQQANNGLKGVTFSYKSTVFYGKAEIQGILSLPTKSLIIRETKLIDLKIGDKSEPCLMTCYLDYSKIGKLEILEGTFISLNAKDKADCGSGKVYLERVNSSDFAKESFLLPKKQKDSLAKKKTVDSIKNLPHPTKSVKKDSTVSTIHSGKPANPIPQKTEIVTPKNQKTTTQKTPKTKSTTTKKENKTGQLPGAIDRMPAPSPDLTKKEELSVPQPEIIRKVPLPRVLKERENNLVKTIQTSEEFIQIDLYDIGFIDNDTISVYHNNELVVSNNRLSLTPITVKIKCTKSDNRHELIIVAENLGDIPPNTALMVVKAGKERYEISLASNEQRNAKVVIEYVPKN